MAQSSSHVDTLRTFGKFLREEKNKVDKEYVNKIIPVLSEIKYADHTMEEIQELIESVKEVLENVETHKSVASIEVELHKASANLEKARNELLTHTRRESGRKVITAQRNDSGCYSVVKPVYKDHHGNDHKVVSKGRWSLFRGEIVLQNDSQLFTDSRLLTDRESMLVTHPEDSEDGDSTIQTIREPAQNEETSKTLHLEEDSTC